MQPVTIAATGGLGNQLFQFAAALGIARGTGREVRVCCRMYDRPAVRRAFLAVRRAVRGLFADADGKFRLDAMARGPAILDVQSIAHETDPADDRRHGLDRESLKRAFRDPGARIAGATVLRTADEALDAAAGRAALPPDSIALVAGYMQDDRVVAPGIESLRAALQLPSGSPYAAQWVNEARSRGSVGVHVRRGDYLKRAFRDTIPLLTAEWYAQAAEVLGGRHGKLSFLVVTDEPGWARKELRLPGPTTIASLGHPASPEEDLAVLASCRHHIISNSTFGWWGARLATAGGTVIAPARWLKDRPVDPHLLPEAWIALDNPEDGRCRG